MKKKTSRLAVAIIVAIVLAVTVIGIVSVSCYRNQNNTAESTWEPQSTADLMPDFVETGYGYDENTDSDGDGLNDHAEHYKYGTDIFVSDTDGDGLSDTRESELQTDPLKQDTDGDGIGDCTELRAGTDPLKKDNNTKCERTLTSDDGTASFALNGNAAIFDATLNIFASAGLSNVPGVISDAYWVHSPDDSEGTLTLTVPSAKADVSIYKLQNDTSFTKVKTNVAEKGGDIVLTASVKNGKYIVGACSALDDLKGSTDNIDVFLLIDDSGSMYDERMGVGKGSDPACKRIDMCKQLIENAPESIRFGLATFTADYMEKSDLTDDRTLIMTELDAIKNLSYEEKDGQFTGTFIATSLYNALDNFSADSSRRQVVVLLTDGATTEGTNLWAELFRDVKGLNETIERANDKKVSVITVALGRDVDVEYLSAIQKLTSGAYIHANSADAMDDLYAAILNAVNYNFTDLNGDGENDSVLIADSGFLPEEDGFSFCNLFAEANDIYSAGLCFGMSTFSSLYYQGELPASLDDMTVTEWQMWWARYIADVLTDRDITVPERVTGYDESTFETAGFAVDEDTGYIDASTPLYTWTADELAKCAEYFQWEFDSAMYDESYRYTEDALTLIDELEVVEVVSHTMGEDAFDMPLYNADIETDSASIQKGSALLKVLTRLHHVQFAEDLLENVTYDFVDHYEVITNQLSSGVPLVMRWGDHAVTLCNIQQDINDPCVYVLNVYDNIYPGVMSQITCTIQTDEGGNKVAAFDRFGSPVEPVFYDIQL